MSTDEERVQQVMHTAPKPPPQRRRTDAYPMTLQVEARYADMDVNGHLNNLALETLHEDIRARLNRHVFPDIYTEDGLSRLVSAQNVVHFLAESHWPATITSAVAVGRIGTSSLVACSALFIGSNCVSTCDTTLVLVADSGPTPIPVEKRHVLESLKLRTSI